MTLQRSATRFREHAEYLAAHEPGLALLVDEDAGTAVISGEIVVPAGGGISRTFQIEIRYLGVDAFALPTAYDPVGRFPPDGERHVEGDGAFCMWLPQTAPTDFDSPEGLDKYLYRLRQFLILQLMYESRLKRNITPHWPGPAWDHGWAGHDEWVREQVARYPACDLLLFVKDIAGGRRATSPDNACPCRSGRTFRRCHRQLTETLKRAAKNPDVSRAIVRVIKETKP